MGLPLFRRKDVSPKLISPLILLLVFAQGVASIAIAAVEQITPKLQPNIVFILVDDLGWADGGCFGSKFYQTPNIDRLAAEGMRFTQAYASSAVCSPTRAAILTGKSPARLHITDWISGRYIRARTFSAHGRYGMTPTRSAAAN